MREPRIAIEIDLQVNGLQPAVRCWNCGSHSLKRVSHCRPLCAPKTTTLVCTECSKITEVLGQWPLENGANGAGSRARRLMVRGDLREMPGSIPCRVCMANP